MNRTSAHQAVLLASLMLATGCGGRAPEHQSGQKVAEGTAASPLQSPQVSTESQAEGVQPAPPAPANQGQPPVGPEQSAPQAQPAQPQPPRAGTNQPNPPRQGEGRPEGPFAGGGRGGGMMLLMREDVQKELGITEQQETKLRDGMRALAPGEGQRPDPQQTAERVRELVNSVLTPNQQKRLSEISLQREGPSALARKEIADKVGLSTVQVEQIAAIYRQASEGARQNMQNMQNMTQEERQAAFEKFRKAREEADKKALAVLNAQQKQKWEALLGKPFRFESQGFRTGGQGGPDGRSRSSSGSG